MNVSAHIFKQDHKEFKVSRNKIDKEIWIIECDDFRLAIPQEMALVLSHDLGLLVEQFQYEQRCADTKREEQLDDASDLEKLSRRYWDDMEKDYQDSYAR